MDKIVKLIQARHIISLAFATPCNYDWRINNRKGLGSAKLPM